MLKTLIVLAALLTLTLPVPATEGKGGDEDPRVVELRSRLARGESLTPAEFEELERLTLVDVSEVRLVLLPATVVNRRGRPVTDLDANDFRLSEDSVAQQIRYFGIADTEPLSIAFLLDLSGSMRAAGKLEAAKQAILHFVDALRPTDRFALIGFADDQVAWITDFTSDHDLFRQRLAVQRGYGQTALFDAVAATPGLIDERIDGRRAIVLITDGFDNASQMNLFTATRLARRVSVPIYTIGFTNLPASIVGPGQLPANLRVLRLFADQTGGRIYPVRAPDDVKEAAVEIDRELRSQYLIGYYSNRSASALGYRRIRLETVRGGMTVRTRQGYYPGQRPETR